LEKGEREFSVRGDGETVEVLVEVLPHHRGLPLPQYATELSSGMDLHAAIDRPLAIEPGRWALVPTGLKLALPPGVEGQVRPRSGLAVQYGVTVLNAPGTIDADYRGEVKVILVNLGDDVFVVKRGDRIAQLVLQRVLRARLHEVDRVDVTERNDRGFGHTGR